MNDPPITRSQRIYLRRFTEWLFTRTEEALDARVCALEAMLTEARVYRRLDELIAA